MMTEKRRLIAALILGLALSALVIVVLPINAAPSGERSSSPTQEFNPCGFDFHINIIPHFPTQDNAINVTYSAMWATSPTPQHQSHQVMSDVIRLDAIYYEPVGFILPVASLWGGNVDVGNFASGTYTVQVHLTTVTTASVVLPPELCGTRSFRVYEELHLVYLPTVAK